MKYIPVAGPSITEKELKYVKDAIENSWYENANEYINRFEVSFADYLGRRYAISLPSCTSALHLSLLSLGVGEGDEVIVPDCTWIATSAPISYVNAIPKFSDIDLNTWCISAKSLEKLITKKTKAVIVVNLYGNMPDWDEIIQICSKYGIAIIEDAAESIGSLYRNQKSGTFGVTSCFSFHGSKTLVTGEGGMLVTDDENIYKKCLVLRDHGRLPGDLLFENFRIGYKYKMSSLQAALGLAQLERIDELINMKRQIFAWYKRHLANIANISLNPKHADVYNSYWMTTLVLSHGFNKKNVIEFFNKNGIQTRPFFNPLTSLKAYSELTAGLEYKKINPNAYDISSRAINLPSALCLQETDVIKIVALINKLLTLEEVV